jgi:hypothetical protein
MEGLAVGSAVALFTAALAWIVGNRLATAWNVELKRRELDLEAIQDFFHLYGDFYAVWKLWHVHVKEDAVAPPHVDPSLRQALLERASEDEGLYHALVLKLCSQRCLTESDTQILARFREAQQCLRESIERRQHLSVKGQPAVGTDWRQAGGAYVAFKALAARTADIIANCPRPAFRRRITAERFTRALIESTGRDYSKNWWIDIPPHTSWRAR